MANKTVGGGSADEVASGVALGTKGALATWVAVLGLLVAGIGFVLPSGPVDPPGNPQLIGKLTGDVLRIPSLKVDAPLVSIRMSQDAELSPPRNPREVGYWDRSARPGSTRGQTLITGHTVHTGGGALDRLGDLRTGSKVMVTRKQDGRQVSAAYRVTDVIVYSKNLLAQNAERLFGQKGRYGRLVLVTCTGWDGRIYHGNVVVLATPLGSTSRPV